VFQLVYSLGDTMGPALSLGNSVDNNDRRPDHSSDALIIRLIIQTILLHPTGAI
jgi:hypothetical protein